MANHRHDHAVFSLQKHPHTSPCLILIAHTERNISQGQERLKVTGYSCARRAKCIVWDYAIKKLPSCPAPCDSAPPPPESSCSGSSYQRFLVSELKYTFPNTFRTSRARVSRNLNAEGNQVGMQTILLLLIYRYLAGTERVYHLFFIADHQYSLMSYYYLSYLCANHPLVYRDRFHLPWPSLEADC